MQKITKAMRLMRIMTGHVTPSRLGQIYSALYEVEKDTLNEYFGTDVSKLSATMRVRACHYYTNQMGGLLTPEERLRYTEQTQQPKLPVTQEQIEEIFNILFLLKSKLDVLPTKEYKPKIQITIPDDLPPEEIGDFVTNEINRLIPQKGK